MLNGFAVLLTLDKMKYPPELIVTLLLVPLVCGSEAEQHHRGSATRGAREETARPNQGGPWCFKKKTTAVLQCRCPS